MIHSPHFEMLMDYTCKAKQKVIGKGVKNLQYTWHSDHHKTTYRTSNGDSKKAKRRKPQPALWTECQKFWFRSWNPAEQLAGFQHLGCEIAADGKLESDLKVKPEKGCIFEKGRYNCVFIQADNRIMPQRQKVLLELRFKEHREPKMCLMACISTTTLNQSLDL